MESALIISQRMIRLDRGGVASFVSNRKTYLTMRLDRQLAWIVLILQ